MKLINCDSSQRIQSQVYLYKTIGSRMSNRLVKSEDTSMIREHIISQHIILSIIFSLCVMKETASSVFSGKSVQQTVTELRADTTHGLSLEEADRRRTTSGSNELHKGSEQTMLGRFVDQLKQPLIVLLLASAAVSLLLGQTDDAVSIAAVIII